MLRQRFSRSDRGTVKLTGYGNDEQCTRFYASKAHFINDLPSLRRPRKYVYLVVQNFLHEEFISFPGPKVFFFREPWHGLTRQTKDNLKSENFDQFVYSYSEHDPNQRMFYVALPDDRQWIVNHLQGREHEVRPHLCCIINRYASGTNLLAERIRFVEAMRDDIHIYGQQPWGDRPNVWKSFPNYRASTPDKLKTLEKYNFVIAFENSDHPGYVTEKLFHAFLAGAIPLYWGGGGYLEQIVPPECYVDCRGSDPVETYTRIKSLGQGEIIGYRRAAREFLQSAEADRFTRRYWAEAIVKMLEAQSAGSVDSSTPAGQRAPQ